jgi:hypothetical protein
MNCDEWRQKVNKDYKDDGNAWLKVKNRSYSRILRTPFVYPSRSRTPLSEAARTRPATPQREGPLWFSLMKEYWLAKFGLSEFADGTQGSIRATGVSWSSSR